MEFSTEQNEFLKGIYVSSWTKVRLDSLLNKIPKKSAMTIEVINFSINSLDENIDYIHKLESSSLYDVRQEYYTKDSSGLAHFLIPKNDIDIFLELILQSKKFSSQINLKEKNIILEFGNLIINSISETWFEYLNKDIYTSIPQLCHGFADELLLSKEGSEKSESILVHFRLNLDNNKYINFLSCGTGDMSLIHESVETEMKAL